jgi:acyl-CoA oxidase
MDNLKLRAFLPLFYLVWSDDLLTQNEFATLQKFILSQNWLSENEKTFLLSQVDILAPPSRQKLTEWKYDIGESISGRADIKSIFDVAVALSGNDPGIKSLKTVFMQLENDLGILGEEAIGNFKMPDNTITAGYKTDSSFDTVKLIQILHGEQAEVIRQVKSIISRKEFAYEASTDTSVYREKVYAWCKILAEENLGNMAYPKKYGGGENITAYFAIMETLSYHDLSLVIKFGVQFGLWGISVLALGTEKHHDKYLKDIGSLKLPGCFAMTETHHGSNVKGLETTAIYDHEKQIFIINTPNKNAQKEYIGNAANHGQMATVFAKLVIDGKDYGVNAFIVPLRTADGDNYAGVTIGDCGLKMGLNGVDNGTITFDNVVIPKENMLDRFARVNDEGNFESPIPSDNRRFFTMLGTLVGGRIGIQRSALSAAKSGLAITIKYSDQRRQFGPEGGSEVPILNYRMHQRRLMPLLAKTYAVHFAVQYLTRRFINRTETDAQEVEAMAAGMKAYSTWSTRDILQECREACGGKGYLSENRIDALKNDTEIYTTFEGDNTVLMQLLAKNRLSGFRKKFGNMTASDIVSYVYEHARTIIAEKNPITSRKTEDAHLLDAQFHLHAFQYREETTLSNAAQRIKKLIGSGLDPYDAFNVSQHQMIDVAQAYLERIVLEQFQLATESVEDKKVKEILVKLCQLYALAQIEKNRGWYLEDGYMEAVKTKAIRKTVNQLCWEIRKDAVPLVEAFDIPESCLAAPIII